jgi:hypothetical protein
LFGKLPAFNQLLRNPGEQLPGILYDDLTTIGILVAMQNRGLVSSATRSDPVRGSFLLHP